MVYVFSIQMYFREIKRCPLVHSFSLSFCSLFTYSLIELFTHSITLGWQQIWASTLWLTEVTGCTTLDLIHCLIFIHSSMKNITYTFFLCNEFSYVCVSLFVYISLETYCKMHDVNALKQHLLFYFQVLSVADLHIKHFPVKIELSVAINFNLPPLNPYMKTSVKSPR